MAQQLPPSHCSYSVVAQKVLQIYSLHRSGGGRGAPATVNRHLLNLEKEQLHALVRHDCNVGAARVHGHRDIRRVAQAGV